MPLYSLSLLLVLLLGGPFWLVQMARSGRYRSGLAGRLGRVPTELAEEVRGRPVIWLHAVSVGEVLAATELIAGLQARFPRYAVAVSTTTEAGQRLARQRFPELAVFYLPLDFAVVVRRYLRVLRPRLLLLMESELWPNLIRESHRSGAAVAVVNARISDRSYPRYLRLRRLWQPILRPVSLFLAQGEETARRLRAIGIAEDRVRVAGNLKYDSKAPTEGAAAERLRAALPEGTALLVAGSTLEGEEALLLRAWAEVRRELPGAVLLLAPRHPTRFDAVAALAAASEGGGRVHRASQLGRGAGIAGGEVVVLDTIGDLAGIYGMATAAFLGGSLVPAGGHNPLEPARFGVPVLMGRSFENFRESVQALQAKEAIRVLRPGDSLAGAMTGLLRGDDDARGMGERGRAVYEAEAGATARCLEALAPLLGMAEAAR